MNNTKRTRRRGRSRHTGFQVKASPTVAVSRVSMTTSESLTSPVNGRKNKNLLFSSGTVRSFPPPCRVKEDGRIHTNCCYRNPERYCPRALMERTRSRFPPAHTHVNKKSRFTRFTKEELTPSHGSRINRMTRFTFAEHFVFRTFKFLLFWLAGKHVTDAEVSLKLYAGTRNVIQVNSSQTRV